MLITVYLNAESIFESEIIAVSSGESILPVSFTAQSSCKCKENSFFSVSSLNLSCNLKPIAYNVYISSESPVYS
jgi:hypothetical protein